MQTLTHGDPVQESAAGSLPCSNCSRAPNFASSREDPFVLTPLHVKSRLTVSRGVGRREITRYVRERTLLRVNAHDKNAKTRPLLAHSRDPFRPGIALVYEGHVRFDLYT
jgi:hypothetical protein